MSLNLYYNHYDSHDKNASDTVVLLHGWGLHSTVWDPIVPTLLQQFNVLLIDLPGLGRSPVANENYRLENLARRVVELIPDNSILMGWSLGGMVAVEVAHQLEQAKRSLKALVTVACNPSFVQRENWAFAMAPEVLEKFRAFLAEDWEGTLIRFLGLQCKGSPSIKDDLRFLREIVFTHGLPASKALREGLVILQNEAVTDLLASISVPSCHILGDQDHLVPVGVSAALKDLQPNAEVAVIKEAAHLPFLSHSDLFLDALGDFMGVSWASASD